MFSDHTTSPQLGRWYCTRCRESGPKHNQKALCPECGEQRLSQGYCPVCEDYVRLPAEALCPKHDVVLEDGPPAASAPIADGRPISWVTVKVFPDSLSAAIPRTRLEAEGISTFLEGERMGSPAMYRVATGGVKLQVPVDQAPEARIILSQTWSLPGDEKDDFEDLL